MTDYFLSLGKDKNVPGCKFFIGETVKYIGKHPEYQDKVYKFGVAAMNLQDTKDDGTLIIEYALFGFPYLVYEDELERIVR